MISCTRMWSLASRRVTWCLVFRPVRGDRRTGTQGLRINGTTGTEGIPRIPGYDGGLRLAGSRGMVTVCGCSSATFSTIRSVIEEFVDVLKSRNIPTDPLLLIAEPALTVKELLRQVGETEAVISARYHNLVLALIQNKPVMALSDHAKLDSLVTDFGLSQYLLPLGNLSPDVLIGKFKELENDMERLRPYIKSELDKYRQALDVLFANSGCGVEASPDGRPSD